MVKFRTVKTSIALSVLLVSIIAFLPAIPADMNSSDETKSIALFTFNSYIDIEYDASALNKNLAIDESISVPVRIKYWTNVPENFLWWIPSWQIRNWILFGAPIGPMQTIHLEVIDRPDWADIHLTQPDVLVNIPTGTEERMVNTTLVVSPKVEAPSTSYTIALKAKCNNIGRINSYETEESVTFTPSFVPTVSITPENPTRTVGPRESINFKITVKNEANKKARIIPNLNSSDVGEWSPTINPPFFDIPSGGQEEFVFSIYTPYDFGWHNEIQSFRIDFTTKIFPLREDAPVGGPYPIYLRVNNYGFSTPGFEIITLLAAIVILGFIIKKKNGK